MFATLNVGNWSANTTKRGCAPPVTPRTAKVDFVIVSAAIEPRLVASVADTFTAGDVACAEVGFAKVNVAVNAVDLFIADDPTVSTIFPSV